MAKDFRPVTLEFIETAPHRFVTRVEIGHPIETVFAALVTDPSEWSKWFKGFGPKSRYLSDARGTGAQREMIMRGMKVTETVLAWDAPTHWAFAIERATMPGVKAMAEDYLLESVGEKTVLRWTVALDAAGPIAGLLGKASAKQFTAAAKKLDAYLSTRPAG